ncbi:MAG: dephospho-CoA kinase [Lewinellaceae bacterium]|nr:dephospho-CoA kinase [Saprospiraceae bacterium]MCB9311483.1 dephospho-CoA kinase [Lewinellaceae bacterium]HRW74863.1 dephospho-CoA kinase [Saprospiraceae bacterium]
MLKVGVTGNIGSGKTTVCRMFESLGVPVIYADQVGRDLLEQDKTLRQEIVLLLGEQSYHEEKADRAFIAAQVFGHPERLAALNELIHPRVQQSVQIWFDSLPKETPYAIEEAALLIESGGYRLLDRLILVSAPEPIRIQRVMDRDGVLRHQVLSRMKHQLDEESKRLFCDFVIDNDGDALLLPQVWHLHQILSRS